MRLKTGSRKWIRIMLRFGFSIMCCRERVGGCGVNGLTYVPGVRDKGGLGVRTRSGSVEDRGCVGE